jgi:hypothetical protein
MKPLPTEGYSGLYFSTATIKGWKHLLKPDKYKMIVTNAMAFLAARQENGALRGQQVGDTAAAPRLGKRGKERKT